MDNVIQLKTFNHEPRVDSREISQHLGVEHKAAFQMVSQYRADFMELGLLPFEMEAVKREGERGAKHHRFALLNEDQCYLLLSYSRNTKKVRGLKLALVKAFREARRAGVAQELTIWQQLQALQLQDAASFAKASFGSHLMLDRKRALPDLRQRQLQLEREFAPQLITG